MKRLRIGLGVLLLLVGLFLLSGALRPPDHVARARATFDVPPERVWEVISDVESWPEWNPEVMRAERASDANGRQVWLVEGSWGVVPTALSAWEPPSLLQTSMDAGDFRGQWTYEIDPDGSGTRLTLTEEGHVENFVFRAFMLFSDEHATMLAYLNALGLRLGVSVEPEKLSN